MKISCHLHWDSQLPQTPQVLTCRGSPPVCSPQQISVSQSLCVLSRHSLRQPGRWPGCPRTSGHKGYGGRHANSKGCGESKGGPREGLVYAPSCTVILRPAGRSRPAGNVLLPARPAGPAPTLTRYFMVLPGQRPRCPRTARRPSLTSQPLPRPPAPVHFAPPARLPACPAALPLVTVFPHANEPPRWAGRAGYCPLWPSPPPAGSLEDTAQPHHSAPVQPLIPLQMLAFCLPYPPTLLTNTGVLTRVRGIRFRSEFLRKMGGLRPQKQLLKTTIL